LELRQQLENLARQAANTRGAKGASGQRGSSGDAAQRMRDALEEMRNAASELRRRDPAQASARSGKALDRLKDAEQQLQGDAGPMSDRRRALGDMQLEARQLADEERQVATELGKLPSGDAARDATRRLAGEQDRLAERVERLQERLRQSAQGSRAPGQAESSKEDRGAQAVAADGARELQRQRLGERLRESAEALRGNGDRTRRPADAEAQQAIARELETLADALGAGTAPGDREARKTADQLARTRELRDRLNGLTRDLEKLGQQQTSTANGRSSAQKAPGDTGRTGLGRQSGAGGESDLQQLREEYSRRLQQTRELLDELRRDEPTVARGGSGFTFEGQGMTLSAPGTEAFKQDFARWEDLRRQATQALDQVESSLSKRLQAQQAHDRLAAGIDDKIPVEYRPQADSYIKALSTKKP
jgi:hypothetical protein